MIDINLIRTNRDLVKENIKKKFQDKKLPLVDEVYDMDVKYRTIRTEADEARSKVNTLSKEIGLLMRDKKLEEARNEKLIGSALEAVVKINLDPKYNEVKEKLGSYLHQLFIVSKVEYTTDGEEVVVEKSTGEKCNRCWNYVDHLDGDICDRCHNIINS